MKILNTILCGIQNTFGGFNWHEIFKFLTCIGISLVIIVLFWATVFGICWLIYKLHCKVYYKIPKIMLSIYIGIPISGILYVFYLIGKHYCGQDLNYDY